MNSLCRRRAAGRAILRFVPGLSRNQNLEIHLDSNRVNQDLGENQDLAVSALLQKTSDLKF